MHPWGQGQGQGCETEPSKLDSLEWLQCNTKFLLISKCKCYVTSSCSQVESRTPNLLQPRLTVAFDVTDWLVKLIPDCEINPFRFSSKVWSLVLNPLAFNGNCGPSYLFKVHFSPLHTAASPDCLICQHVRALHTMHNYKMIYVGSIYPIELSSQRHCISNKSG